MGRGASFIGLLLVAAGLGGYIYFVELKRDPAADVAGTRDKVFTLTPGSIESVEVTNASAETTRLVRQESAWTMTAPEATDADTVEVSTVVSSIENLEQTRVVAEAPDSAAPFGLAPARISIAFTVAGESTPRRLLIGNKTPTGGDMYAQVEGLPKVFLIGGFLEDTFNKSPFAFRDKSVLKFTRDAADTVTITRGTSRLALTRAGSDWRLTQPLNARADFAAADGLISRLFQARMAALITSDGASSLREYGLDRPSLTVTVGSGSATAQLAIGSAQGETHVYARDVSRPLVFTVEKTLVDELTKQTDDLRVKDQFDFRSFNVTTISFVSGGTTYTFTKSAGTGENGADVWSLASPAKTVDAAKMTELLTTTSNLRAESFVAAAHSAGDVVTVNVTYNDSGTTRTEAVTLRKSGTTVHATREGEPGAAVVSTVDFDRVLALLKELAG